MIGCLGGIGRHLSRWMISRGARNFAFMGRSGTDRRTAKLLIEDLIRAGAIVKVTRGDVCDIDAVTAAIKNVDKPIGGVIQAVMSLKARIQLKIPFYLNHLILNQESIFSNMNVSDWHLGLDSKVKGTWNLHHSLPGHDDELDFFIMTSSVTGSIGQATESNYSAANGFLDAFARYRCSLGLPGTSIALGAVKGIGYLAEHPETEMMLQRQGFRAMDQEEMLQLFDLAIWGSPNQPGSTTATSKHPNILTGLDWQNPMRRVMEDPRASIMASEVSRLSFDSNVDAGGKGSGLPQLVTGALSAGDSKTLYTAVEGEVARKLATLVQSPAEQMTAHTRLADIGMDSMLAVQARQEVTLGVDVPLMEFMDNRATVGDVGGRVAEGLLKLSTKG